MKNLKRVLLALLAVLLMCAVVGCGGNDPSSPTGKTDDTTGGAGGAGGATDSIPLGITMIQMNGATVNVKPTHTNESGPFANADTTPVLIASYKIAETELTYEKWYDVYQWAVSDEHGAGKYTFARKGRGDSLHDNQDGKEPSSFTKNKPVVSISWRDAVIWCNAASEREGLTPAYYLQGTTDFTDTTKVVREAEPYATAAGSGKADNAVVNPASNGYRIPTMAEWEYAARGGDQNDAAWNYQYIGCNSLAEALAMSVYSCRSSGSADVKSKTPTQNGLYDLSGNVSEWCWDKLTGDKHYARYANWYYNNNNRFYITDLGEAFTAGDYSKYVGIRLVRSGN